MKQITTGILEARLCQCLLCCLHLRQRFLSAHTLGSRSSTRNAAVRWSCARSCSPRLQREIKLRPWLPVGKIKMHVKVSHNQGESWEQKSWVIDERLKHEKNNAYCTCTVHIYMQDTNAGARWQFLTSIAENNRVEIFPMKAVSLHLDVLHVGAVHVVGEVEPVATAECKLEVEAHGVASPHRISLQVHEVTWSIRSKRATICSTGEKHFLYICIGSRVYLAPWSGPVSSEAVLLPR